ncbi:MAG: putative 2OG-Fe(II) oxygenase [Kiloniellales bacterium]|nr:putative 2OG-Fe(II) oxygenase [Kiloniellales bacterium]
MSTDVKAETVALASGQIETWPEGQTIERWREKSVVLTQFRDTEAYHAALIRRVLELEKDPTLSEEWHRLQGGAKVYHLDRWGCPEAELIQARALTLFKRVFNTEEAFLDLGWATVYRKGDHCMPHSHYRTMASVVYFLTFGDSHPNESASGRFLFADPRLAMCCQQEAGRMTTPCAPIMKEGLMIMFPGQVVHCVSPYTGERPRITLSWNVNKSAIAGSPLPEKLVARTRVGKPPLV